MLAARLAPALLAFAAAALACKGADTASQRADVDADPLALLPAGAIAVGALDVRAAAQSPSFAGSLDGLTDVLVPLGDEAGFRSSRDVDRLIVAGYSGSSVELAAVLTGRFDVAKIAATTRAKNGSAIVAGKYVGFDVYAAGSTMYAPLTAKTLASGTAGGLHRMLERLHDGKLERATPPWIADTLATPGAGLAVAADFTSQPIAAATIGTVSVGWLKGMRLARILGDFKPPGMNFAATLSYGDPQEAQGAAQGVHLLDGWLHVLAPVVGGMTVQNLSARSQAADLACTFAVDDRTLRMLASLAPHTLPALGR